MIPLGNNIYLTGSYSLKSKNKGISQQCFKYATNNNNFRIVRAPKKEQYSLNNSVSWQSLGFMTNRFY